jgi:glycosyltransferase involved in cell wall biosynthesis
MTMENGKKILVMNIQPTSRPIKILLLATSLRSAGGAEKRFRQICRHLFGGSADICVLVNDNSPVKGLENKTIINLNWKNQYSYPHMTMKLRNIIKTRNYDVVMSFGFSANLLLWLASRFYKHPPKLIFSEITRPWSGLTRGVKKTEARLRKNIYRLIYPQADLFTANSIDGIEESVQYFGVKKTQTARIPNVIDEQELQSLALEPLTIDWPSNQSVITVASRLIPMKRIDTLIDAAFLLPKEIDWAIVILGDGPEQDNLYRQAKSLGIANRIRFAGWVKNVYPAIRRSTVQVVTSEYEGFSNSVLDAMFLEVPVITSFCSSDARNMVNQGAALGFEVGDAVTLSRLLATVLSSEKLRQQISQQAKGYCAWHSVVNAIPVYENIIKMVVNSDRK